MSQMCPNCSYDNPDEAKTCVNCSVVLRGLLGENQMLADRYKVVSVLGCGAMGAVYLAEDQRLVGRRTAIKQNRPDPNATVDVRAQSRDQFLAEASILARLDHPSLPKVSDYFIFQEDEYLVMDYVEGEDLDSLLQRTEQPLAEEQVVYWMDQVLDGLTHLHNQTPQPIIHRDIKPANIRLNIIQNRVKLVDFGLVKLLDSKNPETKVELRGLGTPAYAPLEQFATSEQHTDARSDLYALGSTMYHLLTNSYPPDVHQRVLNPEILARPRQLNPRLSENTEQVILKAMEVLPKQRFQSAREMRDALAGGNNRLAAGPPPRRSAPQSAATSPLLFAAFGAVFVLLILAAVTYWLVFREVDRAPINGQPVAAAEESTATATTVFDVQGFNDAPTDTPTATPVVSDTPLPANTEEPTNTPTPEPTASSETPTSPASPRGNFAASVVGTIAYPIFNGTDYDIHLGQADGSGSRLYRKQASQPAFSPDGTRIAFHSWRLDAWGLMTMPVNGGEPRLVARFVEDQLPTWSIDGSEIIFLSRREGDRKSRIMKVGSSQTGSDGVVLGEGEYPSVGFGNQIVFRGWGNTGSGIRRAAAPEVVTSAFQVITDIDDDTAPMLSLNGEKIAFMSRRTGNWEIYVVNADGSNPQRLTDNPADDGLPAWSPDGNLIAFVTNRDGNWAIWATTLDGTTQQQLFALDGAPDGFVGTNRDASRGWLEERISWTR